MKWVAIIVTLFLVVAGACYGAADGQTVSQFLATLPAMFFAGSGIVAFWWDIFE